MYAKVLLILRSNIDSADWGFFAVFPHHTVDGQICICESALRIVAFSSIPIPAHTCEPSSNNHQFVYCVFVQIMLLKHYFLVLMLKNVSI